MTAVIEEIPLLRVYCPEHGEITPPMEQSRRFAEDIADKHDALEHSGVYPEGEDG